MREESMKGKIIGKHERSLREIFCIVDDTKSRYKHSQAGRKHQLTGAMGEWMFLFSLLQQRKKGRKEELLSRIAGMNVEGKWEGKREGGREKREEGGADESAGGDSIFLPQILSSHHFHPHPCLVYHSLLSLSSYIFMFQSLAFVVLALLHLSFLLYYPHFPTQVFWSEHFLHDIKSLKVSSFSFFCSVSL